MQTFYFNEPRLRLTNGGEFFVRLTTYSAYVVLVFVTALFLFSDIESLPWIGGFFLLFLIDRLLHFNEGERSLAELKGSRVNVALAVTSSAYKILNHAFRKARGVGADFQLLLLKELLGQPGVTEALRRLSIQPSDFLKKLEEHVSASEITKQPSFEESYNAIEAIVLAGYQNAKSTNETFIEPRNIFAALISSGHPTIKKIIELFEISNKDVEEAIIFGQWRGRFGRIRRLPATLGGFAHRSNFMRNRVMNRAWTARPTPTLDSFSTDLTDLARNEQIGLLVGHEKEFEHLLQVISRPGNPNALLVGEAGSGKSSMVANIAFKMIKDDVPPVLFDKRLISLEVGEIIANASPEVLAGRLQKIAEEILIAGNIVLFIPTIHDLFRTSETKAINAIDILLPILKSGAIPVIGETYPKEFKQFIEMRSDFLELFEVVEVGELSEADATRLLIYSGIMFERQFKVFITFKAIRKAVAVAHRYFTGRLLPGSAVDLLQQALAKASQEGLKVVDEDTIIQVAERQSKIPIQRADPLEAKKLLGLEDSIHEKLVNQEAAVKAVSRALREYRSGLSRQGGPIAAFLFVGPTGVGKTELAKILTTIQFGSKNAMLRFDMSEYQDKQSIFQFIGTPDGTHTGALTDAVLHTPYALVLLDEFEKAHPDILNLFLQVFDDGRLTDSLGRTVDFQNTIIIATSNAHSDYIKSEIEVGKRAEDIAEELKKKLTTYFKPELINRFSDVIVFRNLTLPETHAVTSFLLKDISDMLKETQGITLIIEESALAKISELGFSPVFGARPLRQVVSEKVKSVLAEKILGKEIERGNQVVLSFQNNEFIFITKT